MLFCMVWCPERHLYGGTGAVPPPAPGPLPSSESHEPYRARCCCRWSGRRVFTVPASAATATSSAKPTIVLMHGGFADASGWNGVVRRLQAKGYPVLAPADPESIST
ncbi:hypothetical protein GCM10023075_73810 [Streptosporangium album]